MKKIILAIAIAVTLSGCNAMNNIMNKDILKKSTTNFNTCDEDPYVLAVMQQNATLLGRPMPVSRCASPNAGCTSIKYKNKTTGEWEYL